MLSSAGELNRVACWWGFLPSFMNLNTHSVVFAAFSMPHSFSFLK